MVYNTGNGASLQKLPDKSQISGKRCWKLRKKRKCLRGNYQELASKRDISRNPGTIPK